MKKGDILTVTEVTEDEAGSLVRVETGETIGIIGAKDVRVGTKMQVGPVCGNWCRLFLLGNAYQAQVLTPAADRLQEAAE